ALLGLLHGSSPRAVLQQARTNLGATAGQVGLSVAFLADQARLLLDAIVRTLYRLSSRKHLLEWETAAAAEQRLGTGAGVFWRHVWPAAAAAVLLGALVFWVHPAALPAAGPLLVVWLLSPIVAYLVSRPLPSGEGAALSAAETQALRRAVRKTWGFFEAFAGP